MLKIENLFKSFGKKQVLNSINLEFEKGKIYGIVGENGAGKTTLFKCISGLERYNGKISSHFKPLKNHLGLLLTESHFISKITGKEYIQLLTDARGVSVSNIEEKNIFNLPLNQYASTYSTGMKKKLALNAILLQKNEVFILDEPFNGVDIQSNLVLVEIIEALKAAGKTIIISSHIFSTLSELCDEIYLIDKSAITKKTKPEDFKALEKELKAITIGETIKILDL